jgi:hypothetical protein
VVLVLKDHELPQYILVSDFARLRLYNLDTDETHEFELKELVNHVHLFDFIAGYQKRVYKEQDPVNIEAAVLMGELHDRLEKVRYTGHFLEVYLVRLLFCLFADDTGIFNRGIFQEYIDLHTKEDGSDLAMHLASLFYILNQPEDQRLTNLDENLAQFPYINGKLFDEVLPPAAFDQEMREMLLKACRLDWGKISPAIFGSMFQAVMNPQERRNLGAHYTSEKNIQKVIKPLFLDDLYREFERVKSNKNKLQEFHDKIASLGFLDPACGCGNFLIISYRELRELEILVLKELYKGGQLELDVSNIIKVDVDQFSGIEYDEFAVRIAEVAMWLIDHQMNLKVSNEFGQYFTRIPITNSANIVHGNALRIDWNDVINGGDIFSQRRKGAKGFQGESKGLSFILGNPPFYGARNQNHEQKIDMNNIFSSVKKAGVLDYVTAWYLKAAQFIQDTKIRCAFVSTSSICQGEQVGILWQELVTNYHIKIHFAHRTFSWSNEAKDNAAVHCIIVGFGLEDIENKRIFDYSDLKGEPTEQVVKRINPYLVEGNDIFIQSIHKPIHNMQEMMKGNAAIDDGNFILIEKEAIDFITKYPSLKHLVKKFIGSDELINGFTRYCLWLKDATPQEIKNNPEINKRVNAVKKWRSESKKEATRKWSDFPTRFMEDRQPDSDYLMIPVVSSEKRKYIPIGFLTKDVIANYSALIIPNASLYLFGILTSEMHMTWVKYVCGRLESRFRYSNTIVYNNYPFPENITEKQRQKVENCAQKVLDIRAKYPNSSLADLYDPLTMPPDLVKAHQNLDKAVDLCYRNQPFVNELNRIEFLFNLYESLTAPLLKPEKKKRSRSK